MPPNPPSNAHGFAMRSMLLRDMQIPKSEKKNSWSPPPKSWGRPWYYTNNNQQTGFLKLKKYYGLSFIQSNEDIFLFY